MRRPNIDICARASVHENIHEMNEGLLLGCEIRREQCDDEEQTHYLHTVYWNNKGDIWMRRIQTSSKTILMDTGRGCIYANSGEVRNYENTKLRTQLDILRA